MTTTTYIYKVLVVILVLMLLSSVAYAQTPRNGSQLGAQQDQARDGSGGGAQLGVAASSSDEPNSGAAGAVAPGDQLREQDQLQDGTGENCDENCDGDGLQMQDRDRVQDQTNQPATADPAQTRAQTQNRLQTAADVEQFAQERTQARLQDGSGDGDQMQSRVQAQAAADTVVAAESLLGKNGSRMSEVAREMNQSMQQLKTREEALRDRGRLSIFLFGQDDEQVQLMQQETEQNQNRINELQQLIQTCDDCDPTVVAALQVQVQTMEQEQARLQTVVDDAAGTRGVFGFLFGWLR